MKRTLIFASILLGVLFGTGIVFAADDVSLGDEYLFVSGSKLEEASAFSSLNGTNKEVSDQWAYVYSTKNSELALEDSFIHWEKGSVDGSAILVIKLFVANEGERIPNISYVPSNESCEFVVYLIENDLMSVDDEEFLSDISETDRLGVLDTYASSSGFKVQYFPSRTVKKGEYYLVFMSTNDAFMLNLSSFSLNEQMSSEDMCTLRYNTTYESVVVDGVFKGNDTEFTRINWKTNALDLNKTDPFAIEIDEINNHRSSTHGINEYGIYCTLRAHAYDNKIAERSILALRIKIPYAGKYLFSVNNNFDECSLVKNTIPSADGNMGYTRVFFGKAPKVYDAQNIEDDIDEYIDLGWYDCKSIDNTVLDSIEVPIAGEYYVLFMPTEESLAMNPYVNGAVLKTNENVVEGDNQWFVLSGIELTPINNDSQDNAQFEYDVAVNPDVRNAVEHDIEVGKASVRAVAADMHGDLIANIVILQEASMNIGDSYTITAPEISGYKFLYWKAGMGCDSKIVSWGYEYNFTVKSGEELFTAVYKNEKKPQNVAVFYNGNGQVLETAKGGIYVIPDLPSMSGFGQAEYWVLYGNDEKYFPGNTGKIEGEMRFVAQYSTPNKVSVKVSDGCLGTGEYLYGDNVTLTAPDKKGALLFNYWTDSSGEIISFDSTFTVVAAFDCEFIAVYKDFLPKATEIRKIQTTQNGAYTIVNFIGTESAIERGVVFGENSTLDNFEMKITTRTDSALFSFENKTGLPFRGYALFEGGRVIYSNN